MNEDTLDPRLERLLSEPEPYMDDDGFASAVMAQLPPPRARGVAAMRRRLAVFGVAGGVASAVAWASASSLLDKVAAPGLTESVTGLIPLVAVCIMATGSLLVALYPLADNAGKALALRGR